MASKWNVDSKIEQGKLAPKEGDWNLAGHGELSGKRERKKRSFLGDSSSDESNCDDDDSSDSSSEEEERGQESKKPAATRVIVEVEALKDLVESNMKCPKCKGHVELLYETVTIATRPYMKCKSNQCSFISHASSPSPAALPQFRDNRMRNTDYALNILYVLSVISNGDGCAEAGRMLGILGLPNDTTMSTRTFGTIEDRIAPVVLSLYNKILVENLVEEVRLSFGEEKKAAFQYWKLSLDKSSNIVLDKQSYPRESVSFDMGWQKRGNLHNSPSGHAFLIGKHTRRPICGDIKSKLCLICKRHEKKGIVGQDHYCVKNYIGSSGGMEPIACADMLCMLHDSYCCNVDLICMDNDSSTRQAVHWNNANYLKNNQTDKLPQVPITVGKNKGKLQDRPDKGQRPGHIPEPTCISDPNHRRKQLTGELLEMSTKKVKESENNNDKDGCKTYWEELWLYGKSAPEVARRPVLFHGQSSARAPLR